MGATINVSGNILCQFNGGTVTGNTSGGASAGIGVGDKSKSDIATLSLNGCTIRDNTRRGLAHARAQGRVGGRPSVMTPERIAAAVKMRAEEHSVAHIAKVLGVGASSVSRALAKVDDEAEATVSP